MIELLRFLLSGLCHQWPEHSLTAYGMPLPLCARCTGMHVAAAMAMLCLFATPATRRRSGLPSGAVVWLLGVLVLAWLVDALNSAAAALWGCSIYRPTNLIRLVTGGGMGLCLGVVLYALLQDALAAQPALASAVSKPSTLGRPAIAGAAGIGLVLLTPWELARAVFLAICAIGPLSIANGLALHWLFPRWQRRGIWLALGVVAATMEVGQLALVRRLLGA